MNEKEEKNKSECNRSKVYVGVQQIGGLHRGQSTTDRRPTSWPECNRSKERQINRERHRSEVFFRKRNSDAESGRSVEFNTPSERDSVGTEGRRRWWWPSDELWCVSSMRSSGENMREPVLEGGRDDSWRGMLVVRCVGCGREDSCGHPPTVAWYLL